MKINYLALLLMPLIGCNLPKEKSGDNNSVAKSSNNTFVEASKEQPEDEFEKKNYLQIHQIYNGPVFNNKEYYRILEIPVEENVTLVTEKISVGEEGSNHKLIKRAMLTAENSVLPQFISKVDSIKFIDSVRIQLIWNKKRIKINLDSLKTNKTK